MIFKFDGKEYKTKELTFDEVCKMEEKGVNFGEIKTKPFSQIAPMISYITDLEVKEVKAKIQEHINNGGKIGDFVNCFELLNECSFF